MLTHVQIEPGGKRKPDPSLPLPKSDPSPFSLPLDNSSRAQGGTGWTLNLTLGCKRKKDCRHYTGREPRESGDP